MGNASLFILKRALLKFGVCVFELLFERRKGAIGSAQGEAPNERGCAWSCCADVPDTCRPGVYFLSLSSLGRAAQHSLHESFALSFIVSQHGHFHLPSVLSSFFCSVVEETPNEKAGAAGFSSFFCSVALSTPKENKPTAGAGDADAVPNEKGAAGAGADAGAGAGAGAGVCGFSSVLSSFFCSLTLSTPKENRPAAGAVLNMKGDAGAAAEAAAEAAAGAGAGFDAGAGAAPNEKGDADAGADAVPNEKGDAGTAAEAAAAAGAGFDAGADGAPNEKGDAGAAAEPAAGAPKLNPLVDGPEAKIDD